MYTRRSSNDWIVPVIVIVAIIVALLLWHPWTTVQSLVQQPPAAAAPAAAAPAQSTAVSQTAVISPEKDWKRVVYDGANRIWQDQLLSGSERPAFDCSFTAPFGGAAVFNGVNAELWLDSNKDGTPDTLIASKGNNISIVLIQDGWYKVVNGPFNGGFEILR